MIQYLALVFVSILGIILAVALVEYVIDEVFNIDIGLTEKISTYVAYLFQTILYAIAAPFRALAEGIFGVSWSPAGYVVMGIVVMVIIAVSIYFVYESMAD